MRDLFEACLTLEEMAHPDRSHLTLSDDGIRMQERPSGGRGLTAMRDHIGAVGGQRVIAGTDDGGTRLSVMLPLPHTKALTDLGLAS